MSWESEKVEEPRDLTRLVWVGIAVLIAVLVGGIWYSTVENTVITRARVKHILIAFDRADPGDRARAQDLIIELKERLENGESFGKLAGEFSDDPLSARSGGDLGWVSMGTLTEPVENFVWDAPVMQLSGIILSQFGFHLVMVTEREISEADRYEQELIKRTQEQAEDQDSTEPPKH